MNRHDTYDDDDEPENIHHPSDDHDEIESDFNDFERDEYPEIEHPRSMKMFDDASLAVS